MQLFQEDLPWARSAVLDTSAPQVFDLEMGLWVARGNRAQWPTGLAFADGLAVGAHSAHGLPLPRSLVLSVVV